MAELAKVLERNLADVRRRMAAACSRAGRRVEDVTLIAVTKYVDAGVMDALVAAGATDIGENRLQVAKPKFEVMKTRPTRHMIGSLQTNKVKAVLELFDAVHSLDRLELADAINLRATQLARPPVPCFLEVNVSGEASKSGFAPDDLSAALAHIAVACPHVALTGFMTMAPANDDPEAARPVFRALRELRDRVAAAWPKGKPQQLGLSMGMSGDFEIAIEEGATHIRVGTALFRDL